LIFAESLGLPGLWRCGVLYGDMWQVAGEDASANQMGRFETKWLSRPDNLAALADLPGQWIDQVQPAAPAENDGARHGFEREPDLW
jgi:hypothetical protein